MARNTTLKTWMELSVSCGHTSDTNLQGWKANHFVPCFPRIQLNSKEIPHQRDTEPMFTEDEVLPEVETQPGDDPQSKNNEGKKRQQRSNIWKLSMTLVAKNLRNWT